MSHDESGASRSDSISLDSASDSSTPANGSSKASLTSSVISSSLSSRDSPRKRVVGIDDNILPGPWSTTKSEDLSRLMSSGRKFGSASAPAIKTIPIPRSPSPPRFSFSSPSVRSSPRTPSFDRSLTASRPQPSPSPALPPRVTSNPRRLREVSPGEFYSSIPDDASSSSSRGATLSQLHIGYRVFPDAGSGTPRRHMVGKMRLSIESNYFSFSGPGLDPPARLSLSDVISAQELRSHNRRVLLTVISRKSLCWSTAGCDKEDIPTDADDLSVLMFFSDDAGFFRARDAIEAITEINPLPRDELSERVERSTAGMRARTIRLNSFVIDDDDDGRASCDQDESLLVSYREPEAVVVGQGSASRRSQRLLGVATGPPRRSYPPNERRFVYPFEGRNAVTITGADVDRLCEGEFLNDSLIDFYLKYLAETLKPEVQKRVHIFSTFFYSRMRGCACILK